MTIPDKRPVAMSELRSGNVIAVPRQRDSDGNPTSWQNVAMLYAETRYEDNDARKPYGVIVLEGGEEVKDPYPEIAKWNVVDQGEPFEVTYENKSGGGKPTYKKKKPDKNTDNPKPVKP